MVPGKHRTGDVKEGRVWCHPGSWTLAGVISTGCLFHLEPSLQIPSFSTLSGVVIGELKPQDCLMLF